ncbi:MAG: hypothetical protein ACRC92_26955 [Peptostreptococcaceae bacterium]
MKFVNMAHMPEWAKYNNEKGLYHEIDNNISHPIGCVVHCFKEYIKDSLKPHIAKFNYEHINTRLALNEYRVKLARRLLIKPRPIIAFAVSLNKNFDGGMLSALPFTMDVSRVMDVRNFTSPIILSDDGTNSEKNMMLAYSFQRMSVDMEVTCVLGSQMQALDCWNYAKTKHPNDIPFYIEMAIDVPFSKKVISEYARIFDMYDKDGNPDLMKIYLHMRNRSVYPIDYKLNTGTGNDQIFFKYKTTAILKSTDNDFNEGEWKENLLRNYQTYKRYNLEVNIPSICYMTANMYRLSLPDRHEAFEEDEELTNSKGEPVIVLPAIGYKRVNWDLETEITKGDMTKNMLLSTAVTYNYKDERDNEAIFFDELASINNGRYTKFIKYLQHEGIILTEDLFMVRVRKPDSNDLVDDPEMFAVSYDNMSVVYLDKEFKSRDVDIDIFINLSAFNEWYNHMVEQDSRIMKYSSMDDLHLRAQKKIKKGIF